MNYVFAKCMCALGAAALAAAAQAAGAGVVPNPTVTGPIRAAATPGDPSHEYPFFAANVDLAGHGYIEEEFFFEGTANRYDTPALATGAVKDSGHPYRTRMLVRRPISAHDFNGTVVVEWQNVTALYDLDAAWQACSDHYIRRGYAWVGVSAQQAGIHSPGTGLRAWSPNRYGTLDVTEGGAILDDALQYDIFSQAVQAVRSPVGVDPLGGLPVQQVFAVGVSQSANRLALYYNSIHPLAGVVDAYLLIGGGGLLRTDLDAKVFKLVSETDIAGNQAGMRQPDSDRLRTWEVAGAAHFDYQVANQIMPLVLRDGITPPGTECDRPPLSRVPYHFVGNAAADQMSRWVSGAGEPPTATQIQLLSPGPPVAVLRDGFGNAMGGIRLAEFAVATATNTGMNSGPGFCRLFGSYEPFDDATLRSMYPDHGTYVSQVVDMTLENWSGGFLVIEDAMATIRAAAQSGMGRY